MSTWENIVAFLTKFTINQLVSNNDITDEFKCSPQGGMRLSKTTQTLVIISKHINNIYEDRWDGNVLYYTGTGRKGNQELKRQNKVLAESDRTGIQVHLFEVFEPKKYKYRGIVTLNDSPYESYQNDETGAQRKVWIFPVRLVQNC